MFIAKSSELKFDCGKGMKIMLTISILAAFASFLFDLYVIFFKKQIINDLDISDGFGEKLHFIRENIMYFLDKGGIFFYIIAFILSLIQIFGCVRMFKGEVSGLYFYSISKVIAIIIPAILFGHRGVASGNIMLAVLFIAFYFIYVRRYTIKPITQ
jgi:hypothetical protein